VKVVEYLLLLVMLLVSYTASAVLPVFGTTAESKYAQKFAPPKGKTVIYIYQRHGDGNGVSPMIWLNNYTIGRLVPGAFTVWKLSAGQLRIRIGGTEPAHLSMVSEAGKIYRFRLSVTQTAAGSRAQLTRMAESSRSDMATTQWIKNPLKVTSVAIRAPARVPAATKPVPAKLVTESPVKKPEHDPSANPKVFIGPSDIGLMLKLGALTLSEDTQMILGANRRFDDSVSGLYAIEAYYQFGSGYTLGGEILSYTAGFTTVGFNDKHDVDVTILLVNGKKYFRTRSSLQPFIGAGIGVASTDISGPTINGNTSGVAYQLMAGVEYRSNNIGVFGEFKYVGADTEDDNNESVDVSGIGFFAGIAFHF